MNQLPSNPHRMAINALHFNNSSFHIPLSMRPSADSIRLLLPHLVRPQAIPLYPTTIPAPLSHHADLLRLPYLHDYNQRSATENPEPKPSQSYIGLIAMAILSSPDRKLILNDIYQWIVDNYIYFRSRGTGWKNSIRHNLSLNDCFVKVDRSSNGKGHFWTIHPANVEDFTRGDFRRRRAQQRVKRHQSQASGEGVAYELSASEEEEENEEMFHSNCVSPGSLVNDISTETPGEEEVKVSAKSPERKLPEKQKKRPFDIDSLLSDQYPSRVKIQKDH